MRTTQAARTEDGSSARDQRRTGHKPSPPSVTITITEKLVAEGFLSRAAQALLQQQQPLLTSFDELVAVC